jgi:hypothetical protein
VTPKPGDAFSIPVIIDEVRAAVRCETLIKGLAPNGTYFRILPAKLFGNPTGYHCSSVVSTESSRRGTPCYKTSQPRCVSEGQNTNYNNPSLTHRVTKAPRKSKVSTIGLAPAAHKTNVNANTLQTGKTR